MSKCSNCLQGFCRKHPLQDHGEREAKLKAQLGDSSKSILSKSVEMMKSRIEQLKAEAIGTKEDDVIHYREQMEAERMIAEQKKRKRGSEKSEEFSRLNPTVASLMLQDDSDSDSSSENSSNSSSKKKSKKRKKEKKKSKQKDKQKKKKRKHRKDKKSSGESD